MDDGVAARVDVPGVTGADDVGPVRAALAAVPLIDVRGRPWTAAQWFAGAVGCALGAVLRQVLPEGLALAAFAVTIVVMVAGRRANSTRKPVGERARTALRVLFVVWALVVGLFVGAAFSAFVGLVIACVVAAAGAREVGTWRAALVAPALEWPSGSEALAVLAVVEDARRVGVHADWIPRLTGLSGARAQAGLDRLGADGLVVRGATTSFFRDRPVLVTAQGQARLAEWRSALDAEPPA
ncbi:hypothetical protein [Oryzobacter telluris]|uniref:hypothetical protein n=1 Tax=Oryzobacter telluris TaxID=3149179 RepID=UPI00370DCE68